jgi:DNA-binding Lrp family transcriptional regulator
MLKHSDKAVLKFLEDLARHGGGDTCTASLPSIASACRISERQVQISTKRLIEAKAIKQVGYDLGNPDRTKRGTVYKVLIRTNGMKHVTEERAKKRSIKFLLYWSEE